MFLARGKTRRARNDAGQVRSGARRGDRDAGKLSLERGASGNSFNSGKPLAGNGLAKPVANQIRTRSLRRKSNRKWAYGPVTPARCRCASTIRTRSSTFSLNQRLRRKLGGAPVRRLCRPACARHSGQDEGDRRDPGARMQVRSLRQARRRSFRKRASRRSSSDPALPGTTAACRRPVHDAAAALPGLE